MGLVLELDLCCYRVRVRMMSGTVLSTRGRGGVGPCGYAGGVYDMQGTVLSTREIAHWHMASLRASH